MTAHMQQIGEEQVRCPSEETRIETLRLQGKTCSILHVISPCCGHFTHRLRLEQFFLFKIGLTDWQTAMQVQELACIITTHEI